MYFYVLTVKESSVHQYGVDDGRYIGRNVLQKINEYIVISVLYSF
jgi:hypothetical protein